MRRIATTALFTISLLLCSDLTQAQQTNRVPQAVMDHWKLMSQGTWISENPYKSEEFPIDAYTMNWKIAPGGMAFVGSMLAIQKGKEDRVMWEFLHYWNPDKQMVISVQYGNNPELGAAIVLGENPPFSSSSLMKGSSHSYATNGDPGPSVGHINEIIDNELHSNSFNIINGKWEKRGVFIWKLRKK